MQDLIVEEDEDAVLSIIFNAVALLAALIPVFGRIPELGCAIASVYFHYKIIEDGI